MKIKTISFVAMATLASYACKKQSNQKPNINGALVLGRGFLDNEIQYVKYFKTPTATSTVDMGIYLDFPENQEFISMNVKDGKDIVSQIKNTSADFAKNIDQVISAYKEIGVNLRLLNSMGEVMQDPANNIVLRFVKNENFKGNELYLGTSSESETTFSGVTKYPDGLESYNRIYLNMEGKGFNDISKMIDIDKECDLDFFKQLSVELNVDIEKAMNLYAIASWENTIVHEIGHVFGLGHPGTGSTSNKLNIFPEGASINSDAKYLGVMKEGDQPELYKVDPDYVIEQLKKGNSITRFTTQEKEILQKLRLELPKIKETIKIMDACQPLAFYDDNPPISFEDRVSYAQQFKEQIKDIDNSLYKRFLLEGKEYERYAGAWKNLDNMQPILDLEAQVSSLTEQELSNRMDKLTQEAIDYLKQSSSSKLPKLSNEVKARGVEADYVQGVAKKLDASSLEFESFYLSLFSDDGQAVSEEGMKTLQYFKDLCTRESTFFDKSLLSDMNNIIDNVMENADLVFDKELKTIINKMNGWELKYPESNIFYQDLADYLKVRYEGNIPAGLGEQGFDDLMRASFNEKESIMQLLLKKI